MTYDRRNFFKGLGLAAGSTLLSSFESGAANLNKMATPSAHDDFWAWVQHSYTVSPNITNLNNGGVSPQPKVVQEALHTYNRLCNEAPSYYMWRILDKGRKALRSDLADLAGVSPEEIAINRNTTESLDTIIFGLDLKEGDEVVLTKYDYPNMMNAWRQREKRDGIKLVWLDLEFPIEDEDSIVQKFADAMTDKTRIVHITHMINWTGQILPAKKIADKAHEMGAEVIVDGAHTFAHLDYTIPDTGADYFGTSLHKWLCAPIGTGMLYVKRDKIANLWPGFPHQHPQSDDIRKFENLGTRSFAIEQAAGHALHFHNSIGNDRKQKRLHELKTYWLSRVADMPGVRAYTSLDPKWSCALATVGIEGKSGEELELFLWKEYRIHTVTITYKGVDGIRVTPHVYTRFSDLDNLIEGFERMTSE